MLQLYVMHVQCTYLWIKLARKLFQSAKSFTQVQLRRTLSREWVAHEFGITYLINERRNRHHTIITISYSRYKSVTGRQVHVVHRLKLILIYAATVVDLWEWPGGPGPTLIWVKKKKS